VGSFFISNGFWHYFSLKVGVMTTKRKIRGSRLQQLRNAEWNSVLAHVASFVLTGVPPVVCESVITEFYCSVKKSIHSIIH
jgi:hypothetical protein